jgi:hypothetical protein
MEQNQVKNEAVAAASNSAVTEASTGLSYDELEKVVIEAFNRSEDEQWELGHALSIIDKEHKYREKGFKTARQCFAARFGFIPPSTVTLCRNIAEAFSKEVTARYRMNKLKLFMRIHEMSGSKEKLPADPGDVMILVPPADKGDGVSGPPADKKFRDCTIDDLQRSLAHHKGQKPIPPQETELAAQLTKAIEQKLGKQHGLTLKPKWKGKNVVITLEGPADRFEALIGALGNAPRPKPVEPPSIPVGGLAESPEEAAMRDKQVQDFGDAMERLKNLPPNPFKPPEKK